MSFLRFFILVMFVTFFNVLKIFQRFFFFKKTCIEMPITNFEKHFWNHRNELIGHSDGSFLS